MKQRNMQNVVQTPLARCEEAEDKSTQPKHTDLLQTRQNKHNAKLKWTGKGLLLIFYKLGWHSLHASK